MPNHLCVGADTAFVENVEENSAQTSALCCVFSPTFCYGTLALPIIPELHVESRQ